jgi:hypothetical protein
MHSAIVYQRLILNLAINPYLAIRKKAYIVLIIVVINYDMVLAGYSMKQIYMCAWLITRIIVQKADQTLLFD